MPKPGCGVQGAFILVGSNTVGPELLVVLTIGVLVYAAWRFWEAAVGQGSDAAYGAFKNFFKFRCSAPGDMPCVAENVALSLLLGAHLRLAFDILVAPMLGSLCGLKGQNEGCAPTLTPLHLRDCVRHAP